MSIFRDAAYGLKRLLMGLYGPATLDERNDPVEQIKREHARDVRLDEQEGESAPPGTAPSA